MRIKLVNRIDMKLVDRVSRSKSSSSSSDSDEGSVESLKVVDIETVVPKGCSSGRMNKGQYSTIHKYPRSMVNNEQAVHGSGIESFYSAVHDLGKLMLEAYKT